MPVSGWIEERYIPLSGIRDRFLAKSNRAGTLCHKRLRYV
ncbi:hypothetical protein CKA32_002679 [Geitlerinema sp. FC II]|nr:hypothetical protein CKA32_006426 [Geitlerinema sp. FC II]PPT11213.1 hypothetical protein CKA32_002679 [Geitlerinema sp. FC II]